MKKAFQLYIINSLLALSFLLVGITGVMKMPGWFSLNPDKYIFMMRIHDWSGIIMVGLVLVHLIQHWKWMVSITKHIFSKPKVKRISILVLAIIFTIIIFLIVLLTSRNNSSNESDSQTINSNSEIESNSFIQTGDCPHGVQDDSAPGLCGLYTDKDNNGECDHGQ